MTQEVRPPSSHLKLVFTAFAVLLLCIPLGLLEPGLPLQTRDAETTYLLMASSLALEGDLRLERGDLVNLWNAFPYQSARFEVLADPTTEDSLLGAAYANPIAYPLLAAPWVAMIGERGPLVLNALAFILLLWLAVRRISRLTDDHGLALLFVLGFFVLSVAGAYMFWIRHETVGMLLVFVAFLFGWHETGGWARSLLAGVTLCLAAAMQPLVAILLLPLLAATVERRRFTDGLAMVAGVALTGILIFTLADRLTGSAMPYFESRTWVEVGSPIDEAIVASDDQGYATPRGASIAGRFGDLLWGQHGGVLPYFPFLIVACFFIRLRRPAEMLLVATLVGALLEMAAVGPPADLSLSPGDRRLLLFYPTILLLVGRPSPRPVLAGWAAGTALLGPLLVMPLGVLVPEGGIQAHVRNAPLAWFPLELERLGSLEDHRRIALPDEMGVLHMRRDRIMYERDEIIPIGAGNATIWLERDAPLEDTVRLSVLSPPPDNRVQIDFAGKRQVLTFEAPNSRQQLQFRLDDATRDLDGRLLYRLRVHATKAGMSSWWEGRQGTDFTGAAISWLGPETILGRPIYQVDWIACGLPSQVETDETFRAAVELRNASPHPWPLEGAARVRLAHRWLHTDGRVAQLGGRTDFDDDELRYPGSHLDPGDSWSGWQRLKAPAKPGTYSVELDLVWEQILWFSELGAATCRQSITVVPRPEWPAVTASDPAETDDSSTSSDPTDE
ncbi:MAG: hypothetical protein AAGD38_20625 [Acidobacteriota bacterium]